MLTITIVGLSLWLAYLLHKPSLDEQITRLLHCLENDLVVREEVYVRAGNRGLLLPDVVAAAQAQLNFRLRSNDIPLEFILVDELPKLIEPIMKTRPVPTSATQENFTESIETKRNEGIDENHSQLEAGFQNLDNITVPSDIVAHRLDVTSSRTLELYFHDTPQMWVDLYDPVAILAYNLDQTHRNDVPFFVTQALYDALLEPDLTMWKQLDYSRAAGKSTFSTYRREVKVNFIAAEESSDSPCDIIKSLEEYMLRYSILDPFVRVNSTIEVLNVSKRRAAKHLMQNSSNELTFFYLTTLRPYANSVEGVPLYHISPKESPTQLPQDHYGTEYQEYQQILDMVVYNISDFVLAVALEISKFVGLPLSPTPNLVLKTSSAMKHYTILGLRDSLALMREKPGVPKAMYQEVCLILDSLVLELRHNWLHQLARVYEVYQELTKLNY